MEDRTFTQGPLTYKVTWKVVEDSSMLNDYFFGTYTSRPTGTTYIDRKDGCVYVKGEPVLCDLPIMRRNEFRYFNPNSTDKPHHAAADYRISHDINELRMWFVKCVVEIEHTKTGIVLSLIESDAYLSSISRHYINSVERDTLESAKDDALEFIIGIDVVAIAKSLA